MTRLIPTIIVGLVLVEIAYGGLICETRWKRHGCSANAGLHSNYCPVPNVDNILLATVHQIASVGTGQFQCNAASYPLASGAEYAFAWNENVIHLTDDCRAVFNVLYEKCEEVPELDCVYKSKTKGCAANAGTQSEVCIVPQVDDIQNVVVHNQQMASIGCTPAPYPLPADPAEAEGLYTWNGNKIYMGPGCRAVFTVHYGECENAGICTVSGDPEVNTTDGLEGKLHGAVPCFYNLASVGSFEVLGLLIGCGGPGVTCIDLLKISYKGETYELDQNGVIQDKDEQPVALPLETSKVSMRIIGSHMIEVKLDSGIFVHWNGERSFKIFIPRDDQFLGKMKGVCGDFDDNPSNDDGFINDPDQFKDKQNCPNNGP